MPLVDALTVTRQDPRRAKLEGGRPLRAAIRVPACGRPAHRHRRTGRRHPVRRAQPGAARRHRHRQDLHRRQDHRGDPAPRDHPRAEQDPGGTTLRRVQGVLPGERRRVFRVVLRLLPARGLRAADRHLHREGKPDQRADRPDAPLGDPGPARTRRRDHRRLGLVHLRHRLGRDLRRDDPGPDRRPQLRPAPGHRRPDRPAVPPQRRRLRPRRLPGARRFAGALARPPRGPRLAAVASSARSSNRSRSSTR